MGCVKFRTVIDKVYRIVLSDESSVYDYGLKG